MRTLLVLLLAAPAALAQPHTHAAPRTRAIEFPDVPGYRTLVTDLHMHTVFSDGAVWPTIRVEEAARDGVDVIAATEHLEYQPHAADIPHPDRNRSFALMQEVAGRHDVLVVNGSEITRDMPPGHTNAIFVRDANALLLDDVTEVFREARRQGAFTFWNHPSWTPHQPDGKAVLSDLHRALIAEGLLDGIEVVNEHRYSEEALALALAHDLVILGTSDVHGLIDWEHAVAEGGHRPVTLVFATDRTEAAFREALIAGRTVVYFDDLLVGRAEHLQPLLEASLRVREAAYLGDSAVLRVTVENRSEVPLLLRHEGDATFHNRAGVVTVPPHGTLVLETKPGARGVGVRLPFRVLNAVTAPGEHPVWTLAADPPPEAE